MKNMQKKEQAAKELDRGLAWKLRNIFEDKCGRKGKVKLMVRGWGWRRSENLGEGLDAGLF